MTQDDKCFAILQLLKDKGINQLVQLSRYDFSFDITDTEILYLCNLLKSYKLINIPIVSKKMENGIFSLSSLKCQINDNGIFALEEKNLRLAME